MHKFKNQKQMELRTKKNERSFIFDSDLKTCLCEVDRDDWSFAIDMSGGSVQKASVSLGLPNIPKDAKALWGKSANHALEQYRSWQRRKAKK